MDRRSVAERIRALRITLQKIEANFPSAEDEPNLAELKRILLLRMADLEAEIALADAEPGEPVKELVPLPDQPPTEAQSTDPGLPEA